MPKDGKIGEVMIRNVENRLFYYELVIQGKELALLTYRKGMPDLRFWLAGVYLRTRRYYMPGINRMRLVERELLE